MFICVEVSKSPLYDRELNTANYYPRKQKINQLYHLSFGAFFLQTNKKILSHKFWKYISYQKSGCYAVFTAEFRWS